MNDKKAVLAGTSTAIMQAIAHAAGGRPRPHALVDGRGLPLVIAVAPGQVRRLTGATGKVAS